MSGVIQRGENSPETALAAINKYLADLHSNRPSVALNSKLSPKGKATLAEILAASNRVFVREGHAGLSMRKVADEAGVAVGNIGYYFKSKQALVDATLREALAEYVEAHIAQIEKARGAPLDMLLNVVGFYVENARQSHPLFFQIWGYAASNPKARERVRELYRPIGRLTHQLVQAVRPDLDDARIREITLQLFSLEEGLKLFIGMGPEGNSALKTAEIQMRELAKKIVLAP